MSELEKALRKMATEWECQADHDLATIEINNETYLDGTTIGRVHTLRRCGRDLNTFCDEVFPGKEAA